MKRLIFIPLLFCSLILSATNYYVKNGGNDSADGESDANAWETITKVNGFTFSPGDSIFFKKGDTFTTSASQGLRPGQSGLSTDHIVFSSYGSGADPIIQGTTYRCLYIYGPDYIDIIGLDFDGSQGIGYEVGYIGNGSNYVNIEDCIFRNGPDDGVHTGTGTYIIITNCAIHDNGDSSLEHGIYIQSDYSTVEYCEIYDNSGYGIHNYNESTPHVDYNIYRYNFVHDNSTGGIILACGTDCSAYYNIVTFNTGHGIRVGSAAYNMVYYNNTVYGNSNYGVQLNSSAYNSIIRNNIIYNNTSGTISNSGSGTVQSNNYTSNPLFVNGGGSYELDTDFQIQEGSGAKDAGYNVSLSEDYWGTLVPQNGVPDIGAHEYTIGEPSATAYYIATNGNDSNPGTFAQPWKNWSKIGDVTLNPGDTVYIRGGTYYTTGTGTTTVHVRWDNINGTISDTIRILAYPGETPVLNLSNITQTTSYVYVLYVQNSNYLHIRGLKITGMAQRVYGSAGTAVFNFLLAGSSHNLIENCEVYNSGMYGFKLNNGANYNLFLNCDAHHLTDPYSQDPYGGSDGFSRTGTSTANYNTFRYCRAWLCSDDGWDHYQTDGYSYMEGCWSFWNGYLDEARTQVAGDGSGFKLGPGNVTTTAATRVVTNCLAVQNRRYGYNQNIGSGFARFASYLYNNTSYNNGIGGYVFTWGAGGDADIFRNNVSWADVSFSFDGDAGDTQDHNTWNGLVTVNASDFVSLNTSVLDDARQADGSLPDITLLHLVTGSDLIDAGIDVGLDYEDSAPDMGCFEYVSGVQIVLPTVTTSAIYNIGTNYASGGGNVTSDGNGTVTARGVCWAIISNPTTADDKTTNGTGTGVFTSSLTDLDDNTLYYVRAYATNEIGTSYGSNVEFTTLEIEIPEPPEIGIIFIDKDGNILKTSGGKLLIPKP